MDAVLEKGPPAPRMPKPHRCRDPGPTLVHEKFVPRTQDYAKVARAYERYNNDNSTFNGKNLSDAKPISNFYKIKGHGPDAVYTKAPIVRAIEKDKK